MYTVIRMNLNLKHLKEEVYLATCLQCKTQDKDYTLMKQP